MKISRIEITVKQVLLIVSMYMKIKDVSFMAYREITHSETYFFHSHMLSFVKVQILKIRTQKPKKKPKINPSKNQIIPVLFLFFFCIKSDESDTV